ncbi:hypothetical protein SERLA73DRAFT_118184 [Serpula lacrymans var. lacrymans S7.3]|uniref:tRNA (cytosine(38)-C(5))-methyltransferase n=2 Tax=Serpula lacrymans var. lacrymans TaxID=341189 RepID=F8QIS7_SERL3|nr:uncharacterized protein SERLADRAFT_453499 [Serpula lacrymans var. lacrymans S7.9]EGN91799.1 hypothetical protein SERLA73DRAFT_118184 [Serpula lacrymans var. lacrymans S7.3]EGO19541.1 hypothetical protein SERLADRAFT_453499 [Serpula lacrymans var. lacrymans S7.9]
MSVRALEFYSGIGGLHLALSRSLRSGSVIQAFDWDQTACKVYAENYGFKLISKVDISSLSALDLASYRADIWLLSPSCQPYTVLNPSRKGASDPRAASFLHLIEDVLPELARQYSRPRYILIENVAGFEMSSTRQTLLSTLKEIGYFVVELLLTPLQFGIPNSRLRYYLLARLIPFESVSLQDSDCGDIWRHIPGQGCDWTDPRSINTAGDDFPVQELREYLDAENDVNIHSYKVTDRVLQKWGHLFDIVLPSSRRTCCFTRGYTRLVERSGSILQANDDLNTTAVFDEFRLKHSQGIEGAVRILDQLGLRYFTPDELLRLFHFESRHYPSNSLIWPDNITLKTKYKLIGNSVNVEVVTRLIDYLLEK